MAKVLKNLTLSWMKILKIPLMLSLIHISEPTRPY